MSKDNTQQIIDIADVRDGVIILNNKALRAILMVSSINFALKSKDEQKAVIYAFQQFLNSLDFPMQIVVQSRRLGIETYLTMLKEKEEKQENELLKIQTRGYREFIASMIKEGVIMTKTFYVIIPFYPGPLESPKFGGKKTRDQKPVSLTEEAFQRHKIQLWQRLEFVAGGLKRCGLQVMPLITNELIELFWSFHHPREAEFGYYPEIPPELAI